MSSDQSQNVKNILEFHKEQISRIVSEYAFEKNLAWSTSLKTAVEAMESGLFNLIIPTRSAKQVLKKAVDFRRAEIEATNRWAIASTVESLATIRLISIKYPQFKKEYSEISKLVCREFGVDK